MTNLIFYKNGNVLFRHPITKEKLSIGRDPLSDIVLADREVSRLHCEIINTRGRLSVKDSSVNGTFLNNKKIKNEFLGAKDELKVGNWMILLDKGKNGNQKNTVAVKSAVTKIIDIDKASAANSSGGIELKIKSPTGGKTYRKSNWTKITFGTCESNDIVIDDDYISKRHCKIEFENNTLFLVDLGSTNGTFYEGERISKIAMPSRAEFRIGMTDVAAKRNGNSEKSKPAVVKRLGHMIGASDSMMEIFAIVRRVAPSDATAFITGESGTGKELVAMSIHDESGRKNKPFVAINCGAIPPNIIETELFGHEKGAFTGASQRHCGVFEQANGGTLFLDEIGEMPIDMQTRLLRVLETGSLRRIGGERDIKVDVRIVAATNQDAKQRVLEGKFREDLFFRLYIMPLHVPPLRERRADIQILARHFAKMFSAENEGKSLNAKALELLNCHQWPGNVRELKNTIQRAVIMNRGGAITASDITLTQLANSDDVRSLPLMSQEKEAVVEALRRSGGNQTGAAHLLGIARSTMANKIKKYEIDLTLMRA
jgi:DNA-binding NtrC family response regulator